MFSARWLKFAVFVLVLLTFASPVLCEGPTREVGLSLPADYDYSRDAVLTVAKASRRIPELDRESARGVGFYLSSDHATASVYFRNGSFVDIAKIAGGYDYRQVMKEKYPHPMYGPVGTCTKGSLDSSPTPWYHDYIPPWLARASSQPPNAIAHMLRNLHTATRTYLKEPVTQVSVLTSFHQADAFISDLKEALSSLGMKTPRSLREHAGLWVYDSHCTSSSFYCSEERLVLAIDYTMTSLSAVLMKEDDCIYISRNRLHDTSLGSNAVTEALDAGQQRLEATLESFTRSALLPDVSAETYYRFDRVLLLGESAQDPVLGNVLHKILPDYIGAKKHSIVQIEEKPDFAASRAAAKISWRATNDPFGSYQLMRGCEGLLGTLLNWLQPTYVNGIRSCPHAFEWWRMFGTSYTHV